MVEDDTHCVLPTIKRMVLSLARQSPGEADVVAGEGFSHCVTYTTNHVFIYFGGKHGSPHVEVKHQSKQSQRSPKYREKHPPDSLSEGLCQHTEIALKKSGLRQWSQKAKTQIEKSEFESNVKVNPDFFLNESDKSERIPD
jgi:hypothetical protein